MYCFDDMSKEKIDNLIWGERAYTLNISEIDAFGGFETMNLIEDNYLAANHSFLYALHEKDCFDKEAFMELCEYISTLKEKDDTITLQLCSIQNELLKHIIYHFDPKDMSRIQNLPDDYTDYILKLEQAINQYLKLSCRNG